MATSTVPRTIATLLSLALFVVSSAVGQNVQPSNQTLPAQAAQSITQLRVGGGHLSAQSSFGIAPLTTDVGSGQSPTSVAAITESGNLTLVDPTNISNLAGKDIAYISCDPNDTDEDATTLVGLAGNVKPQAIVLFSQSSANCALLGNYGYTTIYTMTSASDSRLLYMTITMNAQSSNILTARIGTNSSTTSQGSSSANSNDGAPAPTTAVAMSILYSITGIITLLFLVIIATGAIRAHRHPERYGPRSGFAGRPRQSRAKGLARAMLETLPIVKFGDPEPDKPAHQDIELESQSIHPSPEVAPTQQQKSTASVTPAPQDPATMASGLGPAQEERISNSQDTLPKDGELGCSICTEDFTTGEDVRVLPCNHKYHPACIDPWLLNVSGTCPLCRHDLRPVTSHTSDTSPTDIATNELPPPLTATESGTEVISDSDTNSSPQRHARISRFLDLNRLRHAPPDERIAALRQLREQSQREGEPAQGVSGGEDVEERSRRVRLAGRLREVFRIRTREAGGVAEGSASAEPRRRVYRV